MNSSIELQVRVADGKFRNIFRECKVFFQTVIFFFTFAEETFVKLKNKAVKKSLKVSAYVLGGLLLVLLILPFAFKGKVKKIVLQKAEQSLNAKMSFEGIGLSFFSDFPNLSASLKDFTIVGIDSFATDTLIRAGSVRVSVNLPSLFSDGGFRIGKISVDDADLNIKVLASGKANYDIVKADSTAETPENADTSAMNFDIDIIVLKDVNVSYDDRSLDVLAVCKDVNASLKGRFSSAFTTFKSSLSIESLSYTQAGMTILSGVHAQAEVVADADLNKFVFTLKDNKFKLNDMEFSLDGSIGMPGDDMSFDLRALTSDVTFKQLLSLVPAFYTDDFKSMKADGTLKLDAYVKGLMTDSLWPGFGLKLIVQNASLSYPDLPKSVKDIQIALSVTNPGGLPDNTLVNLSRFHFNLGGNPFDLTAFVATPMSDAAFKAGMRGKLDLGMIKEVYPLPEKTTLQGVFNADLSAVGKMSYVDKKQYDRFSINGKMDVSNVKLAMKDMPEVLVHSGHLAFTSKQAELSALDLNIGKNDLKASGTLSNYLGWFLRNDVLAASLNVSSNYLNMNDFMAGESTTQHTSTAPMEAFVIPENLNFSLKANGKQILFNKLVLSDANALMDVKGGRVTIQDLSAKALGGTMIAKGYYEALNPEKPAVAFGLNLKDVSYGKVFTTFDFVSKMAPIFEKLSGNFSMKLDVNSTLDKQLNPDMMAFNGSGTLNSSNVGLSGVKVLEELASTLKMDKLKNPTIKDLTLSFTIKDGKVTTKPFKVQMAGTNLTLGGITGLDKSIQYDLVVNLPPTLSVAGISELNGTITGTFDKPVVRLNTSSIAKSAAENLANKALKKMVGSNLTDTKAKVQQEIDRKAELIRSQAKAAGDKIIAEAEKRGEELVAKASNPIVKAAAKATAAKIKTEAEKKAAAMMDDAESEIRRMAAEAKSKAD
jgi:hypothetical protein